MIIVAGDSWAAGEWYHTNVTHNGLSQYLNESGYTTINLGRPGGWNGLTVDTLSRFLQLNSFYNNNITHIIVFQTEWIRDLRHNEFSLSIDSDFTENYQVLKNRTISRFYHRLSEIAINYNKKIFIIGGAGDAIMNSNFSKDYPGVEILCQSFSNLIDNNDHAIFNPVFSLFASNYIDLISQIKHLYISKDFDELLNDLDLGNMRISLIKQNNNFSYMHPNRHGHKLLFNFIKEKLII